MRRILILGGTTQARQLAERLADRTDLAVTVSLAGRTAVPAAHPVPVRVGGFGGAEGLAAYLAAQHIEALVDATHPYAATMSTHAVAAAAAAGIPLLAMRRPAWEPATGDRWIEVADVAAAVTALGASPRRAFIALGRNEIAPFAGAPQHHYVFRSVDPIEPKLSLPQAIYLTERGPFTEAGERLLLGQHRIDVVVCKNSGGGATYGKIAAARALDIAVIMLRRPPLPAAPGAESVDEVVAWIDHAAPRGE